MPSWCAKETISSESTPAIQTSLQQPSATSWIPHHLELASPSVPVATSTRYVNHRRYTDRPPWIHCYRQWCNKGFLCDCHYIHCYRGLLNMACISGIFWFSFKWLHALENVLHSCVLTEVVIIVAFCNNHLLIIVENIFKKYTDKRVNMNNSFLKFILRKTQMWKIR